MTIICESCKAEIEEDEVTWPGRGDGEICDYCWGRESSQMWWQEVERAYAFENETRMFYLRLTILMTILGCLITWYFFH